MKNACSAIVLLMLLATGAMAQTFSIKGKVTDGTGAPVPSAVVMLKNTSTGTTTDFDGLYELKSIASKPYVITYTCIGYVTQERMVLLKKDTVLDVKMVVDAQQLNSVVVTGSRYEKKIAEEIVTVEVIKKDLIRNTNAEMSQSVEKVPGVQIIQDKKSRGKAYKAAANIIAYDSYGTKSYQPLPSNNGDDYNTEEYGRIVENEFKNVKEAPLSTFSSDVDKASYSNIRRFIMQATMPPQDAVRVEEMVNYFKYDYPQPTGEHPFSITNEVSECPWDKTHRLVHIGLKGKDIEVKDKPKSNLVFLIDVSGSMDAANKLPLVKSSMRLLVSTLDEKDRVSIVVYAGSAGLVLPPTSGDHKDRILDAIENLSAGGSTAGGQGIELAYKTALENFMKDGNNRVILATDGDFNVGVSSDGELTRMIEEKRETGIYLTVLGFGMGNYKDSKMKQLADKGNGNYAYIDNLMEAQKVMVTEVGGTLFTIAKDVKIQVEFNPVLVKSYRLVGYESRLLENEDFNNDKKDAGEIGAGHTVTALYEIVPTDKGAKENPAVDQLKYQQTNPSDQAQSSGELLTVKFRYKMPKEDKSQLISVPLKDSFTPIANASDNFRFSAAVAGFGMLLSDSKFKGNMTYNKVVSLATDARGKDEGGYRSEFINLVKLAENIAPYKAAK